MSDQDPIMKKFFEAIRSSDRTCLFCSDQFKGFREWCDKEECRKAGVAYMDYKRGSYLRDNYGLIDYIPPPSHSSGLLFYIDYMSRDNSDQNDSDESSKNTSGSAISEEDIKMGESLLEIFRSRLKNNTNK